MLRQLLIAAGALGALVYLGRLANAGSRPVCGSGSTWKALSDDEKAFMLERPMSPALRDSVQRWGGYCARPGFVELVGARGRADAAPPQPQPCSRYVPNPDGSWRCADEIPTELD